MTSLYRQSLQSMKENKLIKMIMIMYIIVLVKMPKHIPDVHFFTLDALVKILQERKEGIYKKILTIRFTFSNSTV